MDAPRRSNRLQDNTVRPTDPLPLPRPSFNSGLNWRASELYVLNLRFDVAEAIPDLSVLKTLVSQRDAVLRESSSGGYTSSND